MTEDDTVDATVVSSLVTSSIQGFAEARRRHTLSLRSMEVGIVESIDSGVARVSGLPDVRSDAMVRFSSGELGLVMDLSEEGVGVVVLEADHRLQSGMEVRPLGRAARIGVGDAVLGRVVDPLGRPLDARGTIAFESYRDVEQEAPPILARAPVREPLMTGITSVDAMVPVGRGQRELIVGDRQTGKTSLAVDTILNQRETDVVSIYCAIGQRSSTVANVIRDLRLHGAMRESIVLAAPSQASAGLQYLAPYAAAALGEHFMHRGRDVLVVFDDMTQHAQAYRELSLLLRRPPGREAYPGDIFYVHSRLLERATNLRPDYGGGSMTALPIVETEAQDISGYIPTNLISITDGQIYLSPDLAQKGIMPAVDVGKSVSRVGGKTQPAALRQVAGELKLAYSQFEELETFARFGTRLDDETRRALDHGRRLREVLKQQRHTPRTLVEQVMLLMALDGRALESVPPEDVEEAAGLLLRRLPDRCPEIVERIASGQSLSDAQCHQIVTAARSLVEEGRDLEESGGKT